MIIAGQLLLTPTPARAELRRGWLRVNNDRIADVGQGDPPTTPDLGGDGSLISPGFVDAHVHIPQFDCIGAAGMTLLDWLDTVVFPTEARWADPAHAADAATRVARQLLAFGTTSIAGYGTVHVEGTRAARETLARAGIRGCLGQVLMDGGAPAELVRPAAQLLDEAANATAFGDLAPALTPRFALSCSEELLRGVGELARGGDQLVQTHLAENERECALARERFGSPTYTDIYRRAGLLTPRTVLAHGVWLDAAERTMLREAGSLIAHCPTANTFLRSGRMNAETLAGSGVGVCLGSDVAGGPERSMVRVARAMIETAEALGNTPPSAAEAWAMITRGNADALGWPVAGRLEPGARADVLIVRPDIAWLDAPDPLARLLYAWDDRWLGTTIAGGRVVYDAPGT